MTTQVNSDILPSHENTNQSSQRLLDIDWKAVHGIKGDSSWNKPYLAAESNESARSDQGNLIKANEYVDDETVLIAKVKQLARMIKQSNCVVAYTGAGLSKSSGIPDYATRATNSVVNAPSNRDANNILNNTEKAHLSSPLLAQPTFAHHVLVAMEKKNFLHYWVQQNHDGLPQKAGYPQEKINEIHGAWFDPSNPVVQFSGGLRTDLFNSMVNMEQKTDLCLCLGTSLSGMNADRMVATAAKKATKGKATGSVIINLQQTQLDNSSSLRIWATLDRVFELLAHELELDDLVANRSVVPKPTAEEFIIPYNEHGVYDATCRMTLDLSNGADVVIVQPGAQNEGAQGIVHAQDLEGNWKIIWQEPLISKKTGKSVKVPVGRAVGRWWINGALTGSIPQLPFINLNPKIQRL